MVAADRPTVEPVNARPLTVEVSWVELIYPAVPRPMMLDWMGAPKVCPFIVEIIKFGVDTVCAFTKKVLTVETTSVLVICAFPIRVVVFVGLTEKLELESILSVAPIV